MGLPGMMLSAIAIAIGAVLYWATYQVTSAGFSTAAVTIMIVGALGFIVSLILFSDSHDPRRTTRVSVDRPANGLSNLSTVREDSK